MSKYIQNKQSGSDIEFWTNVSGTPTLDGYITNAGAWTLGTSNGTQTHIVHGVITAQNNSNVTQISLNPSGNSSFSSTGNLSVGTTSVAGLLGFGNSLILAPPSVPGTGGSILFNGNANTFEIGNNASAIFQIYGNSTLIASAGVAGAWTFGPTAGGVNHRIYGNVGFTIAPTSPNGRTQTLYLADSLVFDSGSDGSNRHEFGVFAINGGEAIKLMAETTNIMMWQMTGATQGQVGIGTTAPAQLLEVRKDQAASTISKTTNTNAGSSGAASWQLEVDGTGKGHIIRNSSVNSSNGGNNSFNFINNTGGVFLSSGATSFSAISDMRFKTKVANFENALSKLTGLSAFTYILNDDKDKHIHLGMSAQEVVEVIPEVVTGDASKMGIAYSSLVPVLVKAVQELKALNDQLTSDNDQLKAYKVQSEDRLATLEARLNNAGF